MPMPSTSAFDLGIHQEGKVTALRGGAVALRLISMGVKPGCDIRLTRRSLGGSASFYCIDRKHFAFRTSEAKAIEVEAKQ